MNLMYNAIVATLESVLGRGSEVERLISLSFNIEDNTSLSEHEFNSSLEDQLNNLSHDTIGTAWLREEARNCQNRYLKGILLSQIDKSQGQTLVQETDLRVSVVKPNDWFLCYAAEEKMLEACNIGAVMGVNGVFVVKFVGRLAAYCTQDMATNNGTFLTGNWYTPVDDADRQKIREDFDSGFGQTELKSGKWLLLRGASEGFIANTGQRLKEIVCDNPNYLDTRLNGVARSIFRDRCTEKFRNEL